MKTSTIGGQLALDFGPPRDVPLAGVPWGLYGTVTGWGPDGSPTTATGYVVTPPRLETSGFSAGVGKFATRVGEPLLCLVIAPVGPDTRYWSIGMSCRPDAQFREMLPPAGLPCPVRRSLARRIAVRDLRAGDTIWLWDEPGKPRHHLAADPVPAGGGRYLLTVTGREPLDLHGQHWVDVADPDSIE